MSFFCAPLFSWGLTNPLVIPQTATLLLDLNSKGWSSQISKPPSTGGTFLLPQITLDKWCHIKPDLTIQLHKNVLRKPKIQLNRKVGGILASVEENSKTTNRTGHKKIQNKTLWTLEEFWLLQGWQGFCKEQFLGVIATHPVENCEANNMTIALQPFIRKHRNNKIPTFKVPLQTADF